MTDIYPAEPSTAGTSTPLDEPPVWPSDYDLAGQPNYADLNDVGGIEAAQIISVDPIEWSEPGVITVTVDPSVIDIDNPPFTVMLRQGETGAGYATNGWDGDTGVVTADIDVLPGPGNWDVELQDESNNVLASGLEMITVSG